MTESCLRESVIYICFALWVVALFSLFAQLSRKAVISTCFSWIFIFSFAQCFSWFSEMVFQRVVGDINNSWNMLLIKKILCTHHIIISIIRNLLWDFLRIKLIEEKWSCNFEIYSVKILIKESFLMMYLKYLLFHKLRANSESIIKWQF
jgi:hypothetical protein